MASQLTSPAAARFITHPASSRCNCATSCREAQVRRRWRRDLDGAGVKGAPSSPNTAHAKHPGGAHACPSCPQSFLTARCQSGPAGSEHVGHQRGRQPDQQHPAAGRNPPRRTTRAGTAAPRVPVAPWHSRAWAWHGQARRPAAYRQVRSRMHTPALLPAHQDEHIYTRSLGPSSPRRAPHRASRPAAAPACGTRKACPILGAGLCAGTTRT